MLGSDYPFPIVDHTPRNVMQRAEFNKKDQAAIHRDMAAKLLCLQGDESDGFC